MEFWSLWPPDLMLSDLRYVFGYRLRARVEAFGLCLTVKEKRPNAAHWTGKQHSAGGIADSDGSAPKHGWELMLKHQTLHAVI